MAGEDRRFAARRERRAGPAGLRVRRVEAVSQPALVQRYAPEKKPGRDS
jgi:hypothetical protein